MTDDLIAQVAQATAALIVAVESGDRLQVIGALNRLLAVLVERNSARLAQDASLLRAVTRRR